MALDITLLDAFLALLDQDGSVTITDLAIPTNKEIVLVSNFLVDNDEYYAIYNEHEDEWEIIKDSLDYNELVTKESEWYQAAFITATKFQSKWGNGISDMKLREIFSKQIIKAVLEEIDEDFINDNCLASGKEPPQRQPILPPQKMSGQWTMDKPSELQTHKHPVLKSRRGRK